MTFDIHCDVLVAGCGVAGLYAALSLPAGLTAIMLSKGPLDECGSALAQGGVSVQRDEDDYEAFYDDTMRAGHFENRAESVDVMIRESRAVIESLVDIGVRFDREGDGSLSYTREAAHSSPRICHCADATGREVTQRLLSKVIALADVRIFEGFELLDIVEDGGVCKGGVIRKPNGTILRVSSRAVLLATGGIGGLFDISTSFPLLTGDSLRIALRHGVEVESLEYVQYHPTALYTGRPGRAFLISESTRGEGAVLLDNKGMRFTDELAPRDVVTSAIRAKLLEEDRDCVWLSFGESNPEWLKARFPSIYKRCLEEGYDITKEPIPVAPAQHYHMGGIQIDLDGRTSMAGLFAAGECSCSGVHGRNRLASNSLLEAMVFARRAAQAIADELCLGAGDQKGAWDDDRMYC